jgi:hypothetical protein
MYVLEESCVFEIINYNILQTWSDYKLVWSKEKYGGIGDVRFPIGKIWKPDVLLYNRFGN